jgi:hypothetical protein
MGGEIEEPSREVFSVGNSTYDSPWAKDRKAPKYFNVEK